MLKWVDEKNINFNFLVQVVGSIRAFYSAIPVDVVVLCEFPLSHCLCYSEDLDQLPMTKYLLYMKWKN